MENSESSAPSRSKRSIRNILISPRKQLRYSFMLAGGSFLFVGLLIGTTMYSLNAVMVGLQEDFNLDPDVIELSRTSINSAFGLLLGLSIFLAMLVVGLGLKISHRFYGPLIPIQRHLEALRAGQYSSRVSLRKGDELQELSMELNELAEDLEKKYGKGQA